jgi:hypothetical protein
MISTFEPDKEKEKKKIKKVEFGSDIVSYQSLQQ